MNENKAQISAKLPSDCPSCGQALSVSELFCRQCKTEVSGNYSLPLLASLSSEDQEFIIQFTKVGGSLKEMAKIWHISYPTVRNRLDQLIETIQQIEEKEEDSS